MIGAVPRTAWLRDAGVELDPKGFVTTREHLRDLRAPGCSPSATSAPAPSSESPPPSEKGSVVVSAVHAYLGRSGPVTR